MSNNPFQSPLEQDGFQSTDGIRPNRNRTQMPAILMMISAVINVLTSGIGFFYWYVMAYQRDSIIEQMERAQADDLEKLKEAGIGIDTFFDIYQYCAG